MVLWLVAGMVLWGGLAPASLLRLVPDEPIVRTVRWIPSAWYARSKAAQEPLLRSRLLDHPMSERSVARLANSVAIVIENRPNDAPSAMDLLASAAMFRRNSSRQSTAFLNSAQLAAFYWPWMVGKETSDHNRGVVLSYVLGSTRDVPNALLKELRSIDEFKEVAKQIQSRASSRNMSFDDRVAIERLEVAVRSGPEDAAESMDRMLNQSEVRGRQAVCQQVVSAPARYMWALDRMHRLAREDEDQFVRQVAFEAEKRILDLTKPNAATTKSP